MEATRETRSHWYRSFILGEWGAFEGQAFEEFSPEIHVVEPFELPDFWERFESMDHGAASPTAWLAWAADEDGNLVVFGEHYQAGLLVSQHAQAILELRKRWHPEGTRPPVFADPSTGARIGVANKWGDPASVKTEYREHGIHLIGGNNDRLAGYARLRELLHVEPARVPSKWAQVPESVGGAPRLYVFKICSNLIGQFQSASIAAEGVGAGCMVDPKWESAHGHAIASARYGAMSWPAASTEPERDDEDPRAALLRKFEERASEGWDEFSEDYEWGRLTSKW